MRKSRFESVTDAILLNRYSLRLRRKLKAVEHWVGRNPDFVILSTGRAGSKYTALLLRQCGISCSHEAFFSPYGFYRSLRYDGESSWLAVPYLEENPLIVRKVFHQVRNPLDVISSLLGIGFFNPQNSNPFASFVREHFEVTGEEVRDCMRFWTEWNTRCEAIANDTYLFEDLLSDPDAFLSEFVRYDELPDARTPSASFGAKKINARDRVDVSLSDLPDGEERDKMRSLAEKYGYRFD